MILDRESVAGRQIRQAVQQVLSHESTELERRNGIYGFQAWLVPP